MTLALPLSLEGHRIIDVYDTPIALLHGLMSEYRANGAEIVAAVNSRDCILDSRDKLRETRADLLAAAKEAMKFVFKREILADEAHAYLALEAAIAKAEPML